MKKLRFIFYNIAIKIINTILNTFYNKEEIKKIEKDIRIIKGGNNGKI